MSAAPNTFASRFWLAIADWIADLGEVVYNWMATLGDVALFFLRITGWIVRRLPRRETLLPAFYQTGVLSLPVVALTGTFIGMVLAVQSYSQFRQLHLETRLGSIINMSLVRELGPVLAATMLAGRVGSAMAAELGTMRVTEQIDALESLGRSPVSHLILPRVLAGMITVPALTMLSNVMGCLAGWVAAKSSISITNADFIFGARYYFRPFDLWYSMIKAVFFAAAVTTIPCYIGYYTQQGAEGVGRSTTVAVVASSVTILFLDTLLAKLLLNT